MNDNLAVFLYRSGEEYPLYGEVRDVNQHFPSTIIGAATRPVGEPIDSTRVGRQEFEEIVDETADDVRWFDAPMQCDDSERGDAGGE